MRLFTLGCVIVFNLLYFWARSAAPLAVARVVETFDCDTSYYIDTPKTSSNETIRRTSVSRFAWGGFVSNESLNADPKPIGSNCGILIRSAEGCLLIRRPGCVIGTRVYTRFDTSTTNFSEVSWPSLGAASPAYSVDCSGANASLRLSTLSSGAPMNNLSLAAFIHDDQQWFESSRWMSASDLQTPQQITFRLNDTTWRPTNTSYGAAQDMEQVDDWGDAELQFQFPAQHAPHMNKIQGMGFSIKNAPNEVFDYPYDDAIGLRIDQMAIGEDVAPPEVPANLLAEALPAGAAIDLSWSAVEANGTPVTGYRIYQSTLASGPFSRMSNELCSGTSFRVQNLINNIPYYYYVTAAVQLPGFLNESSFQTTPATATPADTVAPAPPTQVNANGNYGSTTIRLSWNINTPAESDLAGYNIYRGTSSGNYSAQPINTSGILSADSTFYIDSGLTDGLTYYYAAKSVDHASPGPNYSAFASEALAVARPAVPQGLSAQSGRGLIDLSWSCNPDDALLSGYALYRATNAGGPFVLLRNAKNLQYTDAAVNDSTTYFYYINAISSNLTPSLPSITVSATPGDATPPAAPGGLSAHGGGISNQITLSWNSNTEPDLAGYNIYRSTNSADSSPPRLNAALFRPPAGDSVCYDDLSLENGSRYYYWVSAQDTGGNESALSQCASAQADVPPAIPLAFNVTRGSSGHLLMLSWLPNNEPDIAGFNLMRGTSISTLTLLPVSPITNSSYCDISLLNGCTYYYKMQALDADNNMSDWSDIVSGVPLPAPPSGLHAHTGSVSREILLEWNAAADPDISGYNLYRSTSSDSSFIPISSTMQALTFTDSVPVNDQTYYYVVRARDSAGVESVNSNTISAMASPPPDAPTGVSLFGGPENGTLDLTWNANTEADVVQGGGYRVYRSQAGGGSDQLLNASLIFDPQYHDSGLQTGITYTYKVLAVDADGNMSAFSPAASASPLARPQNVTAVSGPRANQISLSWQPNSESSLTGYLVFRAIAPGGMYLQQNLTPLTAALYADSDLSTSLRYYYKVRAIGANGILSPESVFASALPLAGPEPPTGLAYSNGVANGQLTLRWTAVTKGGITGYKVYRSSVPGGPYSCLTGQKITPTDYTDRNLIDGQWYYYRVTSIDAVGNESAYSAQLAAKSRAVNTQVSIWSGYR